MLSHQIFPMRNLIFLISVMCFFSNCEKSPMTKVEETTASDENQYTPVVAFVNHEPTAFPGSDGKHHLVYEVVLTNTTPLPFTLRKMDVINPETGKSLKIVSQNHIHTITSRLIDKEPVDTIGSGTTAIAFLELSIDPGDPVPDKLCHKMTFGLTDDVPPPFKIFAGLDEDKDEFVVESLCTDVSRNKIPVLLPPLKGGRWIAADGCCSAVRHVRAILPVNGQLAIAQRYAIDWEKINEDQLIFKGDSKDVRSYFCYDEEVVAVADGTVVKVLDGLPDQIPGQLPDLIPLSEADGNHIVLKIAPNQYALYAHLIAGSIAVVEGDKVQQGTILGRVGNSGNSQAPHLHFHMTNGPSSLGAEGIPYVFNRYQLFGHSTSTEAFDRAELEGIPLDVQWIEEETQNNTLSLDQSIVTF